MKIEKISYITPDEALLRMAASILSDDGIIAFPSDTSYGLAANPNSAAAMEKLFLVKGRPANKAVSCIFRSIDDVAEWAIVGRREREMLEDNLPGPFTFLLTPTESYPLSDVRAGVRIPNCIFTKALSEALFFGSTQDGKSEKYLPAYTATSANVSGKPSCYSADEIAEQFADREYQPDLILDAGVLPHLPLSAVVDFTDTGVAILREGAVVPVFRAE